MPTFHSTQARRPILSARPSCVRWTAASALLLFRSRAESRGELEGGGWLGLEGERGLRDCATLDASKRPARTNGRRISCAGSSHRVLTGFRPLVAPGQRPSLMLPRRRSVRPSSVPECWAGSWMAAGIQSCVRGRLCIHGSGPRLPREQFADSETALDKDALMQLRGAWVYEWAELENVTRNQDVSEVCGFKSLLVHSPVILTVTPRRLLEVHVQLPSMHRSEVLGVSCANFGVTLCRDAQGFQASKQARAARLLREMRKDAPVPRVRFFRQGNSEPARGERTESEGERPAPGRHEAVAMLAAGVCQIRNR